MPTTSISVALCTYNGKPFLSAQLRSIAAQDRPPDELVICDDGSSDGSLEVIRGFARCSEIPTHVVVNDENLGSTRNFEQAISLCQGEIVSLADQDDVWYPYKLRRIQEVFLRSNGLQSRRSGSPVAVFGDADLVDSNGRPLGSRLWRTVRFTNSEQQTVERGEALKVLLRHPVVTGATMAFRRELLDLMTPLPARETHDRWISFLLAACGRLVAIPEPLMQYRCHPGQQIGAGPLSLHEAITQADHRGGSFYEDEVVRYRRFAEKIGQGNGRFTDSARILKQIEKKILHLEHRVRLPRTRLARIPPLLQELACGNYWRYSGGWRSLAKDLILNRDS